MKFEKQQNLKRNKYYEHSYFDYSKLKEVVRKCSNYVQLNKESLSNREKDNNYPFIASGSFFDLGSPQVQAHIPDIVLGGGLLQHMEEMSLTENDSEINSSSHIFRQLPHKYAKNFKSLLLKEIEKSNTRFDLEKRNIIEYANKLKTNMNSYDFKKLHSKVYKLKTIIYELYDYSQIQEEAFLKILKKWDKNVATKKITLQSFYQKHLETQSFLKCDLEEELLLCQNFIEWTSCPQASTSIIDLSEVFEDKRTTLDELSIESLLYSKVHRFWLTMNQNAFNRKNKVPVIVVKGKYPGPTLCVTACIHGNELNGIPVVHKLIHDIDPNHLSGNLVAIPIVNGPGYIENKRGFSDNIDLNRCFPGNPMGNRSSQYAYHFMQKVISKINYLVDLHTASYGRANSLYVRADMNNRISKRMAMLQKPSIIVHNSSPGGSLRGAAQELQIPAITVEIGDCSRFQIEMIEKAYEGILNVLNFFNILPSTNLKIPNLSQVVLCSHSRWFYTDIGGILVVHCEVGVWLRKGEVLATIFDCFGDHVKHFICREDCIVVGKSTLPTASSGDRIVHLGFFDGVLEEKSTDGHE